jgi:hypothetical protein
MLVYLLGIVCFAAGIVCLVTAAIYYTIPAWQLPAFIPGHLVRSAHIHKTHAYVTTVAAVLLFILGWCFDGIGSLPTRRQLRSKRTSKFGKLTR